MAERRTLESALAGSTLTGPDSPIEYRPVAVMPDVHAANDVCVGTVMATRDLVYPSAVGGDIGWPSSKTWGGQLSDALLEQAKKKAYALLLG